MGGFFLSYALLVLGLTHNWYGIAPTAVTDTQKVFVISWMVIVTMLILAALRLPAIFVSAASHAAGGREFPMGRPILHA